MNISYPFTITFLDYPSNEDISISIYFMGCSHKCKGCSNPQFANEDYSEGTKEFTVEELLNELKKVSIKHKTNKISIMGGDPLFNNNLSFIKEFLNLNKSFDICIYTGYDVSYVQKNKVNGFKYIKCGVYNKSKKVISKKTDEFMQFASTNQKLYDENFNLLSLKGKYYFNKE